LIKKLKSNENETDSTASSLTYAKNSENNPTQDNKPLLNTQNKKRSSSNLGINKSDSLIIKSDQLKETFNHKHKSNDR